MLEHLEIILKHHVRCREKKMTYKQIKSLEEATRYVLQLSKEELLEDFGTQESIYYFYHLDLAGKMYYGEYDEIYKETNSD